jgi:hypothetical protein
MCDEANSWQDSCWTRSSARSSGQWAHGIIGPSTPPCNTTSPAQWPHSAHDSQQHGKSAFQASTVENWNEGVEPEPREEEEVVVLNSKRKTCSTDCTVLWMNACALFPLGSLFLINICLECNSRRNAIVGSPCCSTGKVCASDATKLSILSAKRLTVLIRLCRRKARLVYGKKNFGVSLMRIVFRPSSIHCLVASSESLSSPSEAPTDLSIACSPIVSDSSQPSSYTVVAHRVVLRCQQLTTRHHICAGHAYNVVHTTSLCCLMLLWRLARCRIVDSWRCFFAECLRYLGCW